MRSFIIFLTVWFCFLTQGCKTTEPRGTSNNEQAAKDASKWVSERSGYIRLGAQLITHTVIYSSEKDSEERLKILKTINTVSKNLNALVENRQIDPEAVVVALKVEEEYAGSVLSALSSLYSAEYNHFKDNGYALFAIELLKAVSKGVEDGTVE